MKIEKRVTTIYIDVEDDQQYQFDPIEDTVILEPNNTDEKFKGEFLLKYLTYDSSPMSPDEWGNDEIFLVHYHRQIQIENDLINKDDLIDLFRGEEIDKDHYLNDYWIFFTSAYIHGGVVLSLGGSFPCDPGGWDTSVCGAVLCKKDQFDTEDKAHKSAEGLISEWNSVLSGDVYCCVVEKLNENKESYDFDIVGGYVGLEWAKQALKEEF